MFPWPHNNADHKHRDPLAWRTVHWLMRSGLGQPQHGQRALHVLRKRRPDAEWRAAARVRHRQRGGVQRLAVQPGPHQAVDIIPEDGMAPVRQMYPDLVGPPRQRLALHEAGAPAGRGRAQ